MKDGKVYYIHRSHCGLCDQVRPQVEEISKFSECEFIPINVDSEEIPERIRFILVENEIYSLPVVFVKEEDCEYEYFGKEDNGKINLSALKKRLRSVK